MTAEQMTAARKIQALFNMKQTNGCSEGETMTAMSRIGELLTVYNLTLDQVLLDSETCIDLVIDTGSAQRSPLSRTLTALGDFVDCKVWMSKDWASAVRKYTIKYHFFGLKQDVQMAEYLYHMIENCIEQEVANFKTSALYIEQTGRGVHGKRLTVSFMAGMVSRIYNRLEAETKTRKVEENSKTVSYVDVKTSQTKTCSIVLMKKNKVQSEFEKMGLRLRTQTSYSRQSHHSAFGAGQTAGEKVNFNRPIGNSSSRGLTLTAG